MDETHTPQPHVSRSIFQILKPDSIHAIRPKGEALAIAQLMTPVLFFRTIRFSLLGQEIRGSL